MPVQVSPDWQGPQPTGRSATNPNAPYGYKPTLLSDTQIGAYCYVAGFKGSELVTAIAVALAESSGLTAAHNVAPYQGITYDYWGLFQISTIHSSLGGIAVSEETATDPLQNCEMAYDLSGGGRNWLPWDTYKNGAYTKFVARAQQAAYAAPAAAGSIALGGTTPGTVSGGSGNLTGITTDVNPNEYTPLFKPTVYSKVVPVWRVDDVRIELVAADRTLLNYGGLHSVPVGGSGSTLQDLLVSVAVSMDNSQSTQVTLTFEQGDVIAAEGLGFPAQPDVTISRVTIRDLVLGVTSCELVANPAGRPQWQIVCISEAQMALMDAYPPVGGDPSSTPGTTYAPNGFDFSYNPNDASQTAPSGAQDQTVPANVPGGESADDYLNRMCGHFKIPFYGETSNEIKALDGTVLYKNTTMAGQPGTANMAGYNPYGSFVSGTLPDSVWVYAQRLAGFFGFWFYEAQGAIWFAQPSTLVEWGNKLYVNYKQVIGIGGDGQPIYSSPLDGTEPIGTPRLSADIEETPGGFSHVNKRQVVRQIEVDLAPWYACQARPGDELVLSGFWNGKNSPWDTNPFAPDHWVGAMYSQQPNWPTPGQKYIITSVNFAIDGGVTAVKVKAEEVRDPNPQVDLNQLNTNPTYITGGDPTGATTTAYVRSASVESQLGPNWQTARRAVDALFLANSQQGVKYQWGGISPQAGFDCSGLAYWACLQVGVNPTNQPRTSQQLWSAIVGAHRQMSVAQALNVPFALLFPADPASAPSHVAISMGDGHSVLQAPQTGEVVNVSDITANGWLVQAGTLPTLDYTAAPTSGASPDKVAMLA